MQQSFMPDEPEVPKGSTGRKKKFTHEILYLSNFRYKLFGNDWQRWRKYESFDVANTAMKNLRRKYGHLKWEFKLREL